MELRKFPLDHIMNMALEMNIGDIHYGEMTKIFHHDELHI